MEIGRWNRAYPGVVKVCHELGKYDTDRQGIDAFNRFLPNLSGLPVGSAHYVICSHGYGNEKHFWGEIHFAHEQTAREYQDKYGGRLSWCVEIHGEDKGSEVESTVKAWVDNQKASMGGRPTDLKVDIVDNSGSKGSWSLHKSARAYVYVNDPGAAMLLKLTMGGKA